MKNFDIGSNLKKNPSLNKKLFLQIKEEVLGKKYELSLFFIGQKKSKKLNKIYRQKNYSANILSFPLDKDLGEIFIDWHTCQKEAKKWNYQPQDFLVFLFIHGLAHLKGYDHQNNKEAEIMERFEKKIRKKFLKK